jgi:tetratricopeptide (TPR) repeat protein
MTAKELPQSYRALYEKAVAAVRLSNSDYAIQILQSILKEVPEFLEGRQLCRKAAIQKRGGATGSKKFLSVNTSSLSVMKIQPKSKKDPAGAIADLEEILAEDPFSVQANQMLFDCAVALKLNSTAAFALETVRAGHPDNVKVMHRLASFYMENDDPEKAVAVYKAIQTVDPTDGEARRGFTNANAQLSMKTQKWGANTESGSNISSLKNLSKNNEESVILELLGKQGLTPEQNQMVLDHYMKLYSEDQSNINHVRQIAEVLERLERYDEAYQFYHYAWSLSNGDTSLETKVLKLQDKLSEIHMQQVAAWINENPDHPDLITQQEELTRLKLEREERLVAVSKDRVEKNPTDMQLRFELGSHLYAAGHPTEAIPELQKAKGNPHIRTKAMVILSKCYSDKNMTDLAIRQLEEAVNELHVMDDSKKEALYDLGKLNIRLGKKDRALDAWKQVYESDYGYRDIARLVEESYGQN